MSQSNNIIKDTVHGYISIPKTYIKNLIDNEYFQRLRNIEQTGMRVLYPNAKHDRFSHSLGVYYLGQKAIDAFCRGIGDETIGESECRRYKVLFHVACLLHDIGHTPFSHSLEDQVFNNSTISSPKKGRPKKTDEKGKKIDEQLVEIINDKESIFCDANGIDHSRIDKIHAASHEMLGSYLIVDKLCKNICAIEKDMSIYIDDTAFQDDICFIIRMIMGVKYNELVKERQVRNSFIELLNGDNFDVDKLDYIMRDTQMSGIDNISVDVERLLGSLCMITKTRYVQIKDINIQNKDSVLTIARLTNNGTDFAAKGNFKGTLQIEKGAEIVFRAGSSIEKLCGETLEMATIAYVNNDHAVFSIESMLKQDNNWINAQPMSGFDSSVKYLTGGTNTQSFSVYIEKATLLTDFKFKAGSTINISFFGKCDISINGIFNAVGSFKVFNIESITGNLQELELLGDTLENYNTIRGCSNSSYNTYTIGFRKQAMNVIANVLDARNYLYLWIYAHHKVVYYANFLLPIIAKELSQKCGSVDFPAWELNYDSITKLDDYYIWTAIKYLLSNANAIKLSKDYEDLIEQLLNRNYYKSLYKSLAEFELYFDSFDKEQKEKAFETLCKQANLRRPFLGEQRKRALVAGYLNNAAINKINSIIRDIAAKRGNEVCASVTQVIFVVADFKQKQLDPNKVFLDMGDEVLPISQISLLSANNPYSKQKTKYFYLYYATDDSATVTHMDRRIIKDAIKAFLS